LNELFARYPVLSVCKSEIAKAIAILKTAFRSGNKLLVAGNGGSAADALHIVGELMKGFIMPRKFTGAQKARFARLPDSEYLVSNLQSALPAISLINESALSTAFANDNASDLVFAQQVYGLGNGGDVFWGISTSGNSKNIIFAAQTAAAKGMKLIGLTGESGGSLKSLCDVCIQVPEKKTYKIQELHLPVYHAICLELEKEFFD
jgi:D-sedoheptulose 7-phosphate isomerase